MKIKARVIFAGAFCLALAACGAPGTPPVINKAPDRVIPSVVAARAGDSVYAIAWRYGLDYQNIVKWNALKKPYSVRAGQRLRLLPPGATRSTAAASKTKTVKTISSTKVASTKSTKSAKSTKSTKTSTGTSRSPKKWRWPAKGEIIAKFSQRNGTNGIKIAGAPGSAIVATAAGEVVYAGEGLRGYGKLIIIEHSPSYLSAYAHNRKIMVREGARIRSGQQIAQMGDSGAERVMLHFEIRKSGKPVDPLKFLK